MSKKSLDRDTAVVVITQSREAGKTDQQIHNELSQEYADKKKLAILITSTARVELKEKYKSLNNLLVGLLAAGAITKILFIITVALGEQDPWLMLMVLWVPLFNLYGVYYISRYFAPMYFFCGGFAVVSILESLKGQGGVADTVFTILFAIAIAVLSFYLDKKMFPNFKPFGLKKDSNGEFILNQAT